jgi:hypothetical protein
MSTKYRVHRFDLRMTADQSKLEQFLNSLKGEIIAVIPNVTWFPSATHVDFLLSWKKRLESKCRVPKGKCRLNVANTTL